MGVKREMKVLFMSSTKVKGSISLKETRGREKEKEKDLDEQPMYWERNSCPEEGSV